MSVHYAIRQGNLACVQECLDAGTPVDVRDDNQCTILFWATYFNRRKVALLLLNRGAAVDAQDKWGNTPLHYAANHGYVEMVLLLLNHGATVDARNQSKNTPLDRAEYWGRRGTAQLLQDWPYYKCAINRLQKESLVAFWMARHPRLGQDSPAHVLPAELYTYITQCVVAEHLNHTAEEIHAIAEQERESMLFL